MRSAWIWVGSTLLVGLGAVVGCGGSSESDELTGHVPVESATLPALNHLFTPAGSPPQTEQHVADEVLDRVAAFIAALKSI